MTTANLKTAHQRIRPTLDTPFHIDYEWWERDKRSLRIYLISHLPAEKQGLFSAQEENQIVDWVDPETAEVRRVDSLQMALQEAAEAENFLTEHTSLVDAVFRVFLANNNSPVTPRELGSLIGRPPEMVLRTLSGAQIYKGLRPIIG